LGADEDWGEEVHVEEGAVAGSSDADSCSGSSSSNPGEHDEGETELALLNLELAALNATGSGAVHSHSSALGDGDVDDNGGEWEVVTRKRDQAVAHRDSSSKATVLPGWYNGDDEEAGWIGPTSANASSASTACSAVVEQTGVADEEVSESAVQASAADSSDVAVLPAAPCVRVVTADFAMQNVLLQMGIQVVGTGGRMVRGVKTFVLKCHSCFKICMDATREFCPHCGNHTMMKVRRGCARFCVFCADDSFFEPFFRESPSFVMCSR
jgi:hypothetical protein